MDAWNYSNKRENYVELVCLPSNLEKMEHITTSVNDVTTDENGLFGMMGGNERGGGGGGEGGGGGDGGGGGGEEVTLKKGPWTTAEDAILIDYVTKNGEGNWNAVQRNTGLNRCGKSCRLRWANHLRPNLKKGAFSPEEEKLIIELHSQFGNKWARMAALLPGRTDNEIKNFMNTRIKRRQRQGLPLYTDDHDRPTTPTTPTTPSPCATPTGSNPNNNNTATKFEFFHQQHYHHHHQHHPLSPTAPPHHHSPLSSPLQHNRTTPHSSYSPHTFLDTSPASAIPLSSSSPSPLSFTFQRPAPLLCSPLRFKRYRSSPSFNTLHVSNPITIANNNHSMMINSQSQSRSQSLSNLEGFRFPSVQLNSSTFSQYFQTPLLDSSSDRGVSSSSSSSPFSTKLELPSNQYLNKPSEQDFSDPSFQTNSGLLGDLLIEAQALASGQNSKKRSYLSLNEGNDVFDGCQSLDDYPLYWSSNSGQKSKEEGPDLSKFMNDEDLSTLLTVMPSSSTVQSEQDWQNNNSTQEISNNVQSSSSGVNTMTNDNFGVDVKPIASLFPLSNNTTNHNENTGCYTWDNLPGLC